MLKLSLKCIKNTNNIIKSTTMRKEQYHSFIKKIPLKCAKSTTKVY